MNNRYYDLFRTVSGAKSESVNAAKHFFSNFEELNGDLVTTAQRVRTCILEGGFCYHDKVFTLQDIMEKKSGNCLGLTLLIGAELLNRGYRPEFRIITHPQDAIHKQDLRFFKELCRGEHFDYDNPILPMEQAKHPMYRFAPLEHPLMVLEGKEFDLTNLDVEEDPFWTPPAEKRMDVEFHHVASCVLVDRAQIEFLSDRFDFKTLTRYCMEAIEIWPDNLEAWEFLWYLGSKIKDENLKKKARKRYLDQEGDDSRYHYNAYEMTSDEGHLDMALEKFPAFKDAFFEKHVIKATDKQEKRFNFAVTAWCVANSCAYDLKRFYRENKRLLTTIGF